MKTLDEVIRALEICWEQGTCSKECPYMMAEPSCGLRRELDALHYLKEYRTILPLVPSLINTAIAVQKKGKTIG